MVHFRLTTHPSIHNYSNNRQNFLHFPAPNSRSGFIADRTPIVVPRTFPAVPMPEDKACAPTVNKPKVFPCLLAPVAFSSFVGPFLSSGMVAPWIRRTKLRNSVNRIYGE